MYLIFKNKGMASVCTWPTTKTSTRAYLTPLTDKDDANEALYPETAPLQNFGLISERSGRDEIGIQMLLLSAFSVTKEPFWRKLPALLHLMSRRYVYKVLRFAANIFEILVLAFIGAGSGIAGGAAAPPGAPATPPPAFFMLSWLCRTHSQISDVLANQICLDAITIQPSEHSMHAQRTITATQNLGEWVSVYS